jgi:hypothetical protein
VLTFTGQHVVLEYGAPSIRDIAVQLMRLDRFGGAGVAFWPVGLHSMLVAAMLPPELEHHGLLHDSPECCVADVPRPFKTDAARAVEARLMTRIYSSLGIVLPTPEEAKLIHAADIRAVNAEGLLGCGPPGYQETQPNWVWDEYAVRLYDELYRNYGSNVSELVSANGLPSLTFERLLRIAICRAQRTPETIKMYTDAA